MRRLSMASSGSVSKADGVKPSGSPMLVAKKWVATRPLLQRAVTNLFHRMYHGSPGRTWQNTRWLGAPLLKCPFDLWIYQELLTRVRPDVIVETGTHKGGSAFYLASICDLLDHGRVITVDVREKSDRPQHPRITYLTGSSTSAEIVSRITNEASGTTMVILDSNHSRDHVLEELEAYSPLVAPGSYVIVEDTNVNGHPSHPKFGPGPWEAVEAFLASHPEFRVDVDCEKFFLTMNPRGYLQRV
jgi:cephalosporin hydroxylase